VCWHVSISWSPLWSATTHDVPCVRRSAACVSGISSAVIDVPTPHSSAAAQKYALHGGSDPGMVAEMVSQVRCAARARPNQDDSHSLSQSPALPVNSWLASIKFGSGATSVLAGGKYMCLQILYPRSRIDLMECIRVGNNTYAPVAAICRLASEAHFISFVRRVNGWWRVNDNDVEEHTCAALGPWLADGTTLIYSRVEDAFGCPPLLDGVPRGLTNNSPARNACYTNVVIQALVALQIDLAPLQGVVTGHPPWLQVVRKCLELYNMQPAHEATAAASKLTQRLCDDAGLNWGAGAGKHGPAIVCLEKVLNCCTHRDVSTWRWKETGTAVFSHPPFLVLACRWKCAGCLKYSLMGQMWCENHGGSTAFRAPHVTPILTFANVAYCTAHLVYHHVPCEEMTLSANNVGDGQSSSSGGGGVAHGDGAVGPEGGSEEESDTFSGGEGCGLGWPLNPNRRQRVRPGASPQAVAAVMIQSLARSYATRRQFLARRSAALVVQRQFRRRQAVGKSELQGDAMLAQTLAREENDAADARKAGVAADARFAREIARFEASTLAHVKRKSEEAVNDAAAAAAAPRRQTRLSVQAAVGERSRRAGMDSSWARIYEEAKIRGIEATGAAVGPEGGAEATGAAVGAEGAAEPPVRAKRARSPHRSSPTENPRLGRRSTGEQGVAAANVGAVSYRPGHKRGRLSGPTLPM
jgi:hypothetical protein